MSSKRDRSTVCDPKPSIGEGTPSAALVAAALASVLGAGSAWAHHQAGPLPSFGSKSGAPLLSEGQGILHLQLAFSHRAHAQSGDQRVPSPEGERTEALLGQLTAVLGVHERLSLSLGLPVAGFAHTHGTEPGGPLASPDHVGDEASRAGLGDPLFMMRLAALAEPVRIVLGAGASLPVGGVGGAAENVAGVLVATGTMDLVLALDVEWPFLERFRLLGSGLMRAPLYETPSYDRAGSTIAVSAGLGWSFLPGLSASLAVDLLDRGKDLWRGLFAEGSGGRWVHLTPGISYEQDAWSAFAGFQWPLYQKINGEQLVEDFNVVAGIAWRWGEHAAAPRGDAHAAPRLPGASSATGAAEDAAAPAEPPADVTDVIVHGEDAELVPVPGKVTVFDFWAPWCAPCQELDGRLRDLDRRLRGGAASSGAAIAIRRVNIVDWETPAARRYLGEVPALPYIRVIGPDGALLFERFGPPAVLVEDIEAVLGK